MVFVFEDIQKEDLDTKIDILKDSLPLAEVQFIT